jgi:hypothetical protein
MVACDKREQAMSEKSPGYDLLMKPVSPQNLLRKVR